MKERRHHNNDGRRQIARGKTRDQVREIARRLGVLTENPRPKGSGPVLVSTNGMKPN